MTKIDGLAFSLMGIGKFEISKYLELSGSDSAFKIKLLYDVL